MISVIIPMYNSKNTIIPAIESVINQTYQGPIEILIINDGSSDASENIVENYIKKNKTRIELKLFNKKNGGVSSARNAGIFQSSGEWLAFLDSDDIWKPQKLQKQIDILNKNDNICFIGTNRNSEKYPYFGKSKRHLFALTAKEVLLKWYPQTSTVMLKKNILTTLEIYDETRTHAEDGDCWLKILKFTKLFVLNENLVLTGGNKRNYGDSGLSVDLLKMYKGEILALRGAKNRKQINSPEYIFFYIWISFRYYRRRMIVGFSK